MEKFFDLLKFEAQEILLSFKKASIEGQGTPQEVADRREASFVSSFISKYFPFPFRVVKGNIIDSYGSRSNSIDCVMLSQSHPFTIDPKNDKASIIFADGVDFVIEVKPKLDTDVELNRVLEQIRSVKKLKRCRNDDLLRKRKGVALENSFRIPTFIFCTSAYNDRTLLDKIADHYIKNNVPLIEQFDYIVVLSDDNKKSRIYFNLYNGSYADSDSTPNSIKYIYQETGENTLIQFLFNLDKVAKSEPRISQSVLYPYFPQGCFGTSAKTFMDINDKLAKFYFPSK